jgi:sulfate adenylyltransferase subunit 1
MATGASTAGAAVVLIDARKGVLAQSRRHAYIASLLGVRHILVAVNKMDLVDYDEQVFRAIEHDFHRLLQQISADTGSPVEPIFVPVSALVGDNVVHRSDAMPWYGRSSLLEVLESLPSSADRHDEPFRFPVQRVLRPTAEFRGFSGQIASGTIRPGDTITVLPSGLGAIVTSVVTFDGELDQAETPLSVTLTLDRELDISRGDLMVSSDAPATLTRRCKAALVWMDQRSLERGRRYLLKHSCQTVSASIPSLDHRTDIETLAREPAETLGMNDIGVATLQFARPIAVDRYAENRTTGAFVLIDPETNGTIAAGMVLDVESAETVEEAVPADTRPITAEERAQQWGHRGGILELKGPPESIDRIERSLFVANMVTIRCLTEQQAQFAAASGLIALLIKLSDIETLTMRIAGDEATVDGSDVEKAVAAVRQLLARSGIRTASQKSGPQ